MYCKKCGSYMPDGSRFCTECGSRFENASSGQAYEGAAEEKTRPGGSGAGYSAPEKASSGEKSSMPQLAEGEFVVRSYVAAELKRPSGKGYLTVTNKRIMFHGRTQKSMIRKEVALDSVSGMESFVGTNYNYYLLVLGGLLCLIGLYVLVSVIGNSRHAGLEVVPGVILPLFVGGMCILAGIVQSCTVRIFSSAAIGTPIEFGRGAASLNGNRAALLLVCVATKDTMRMTKELGALVMDLQTYGDKAIEKWKN